MQREDISISIERLANLRELAEGAYDYDYVENEGEMRVRFDRGAVSAWADLAGPDPINFEGDKRMIAQLKKLKP